MGEDERKKKKKRKTLEFREKARNEHSTTMARLTKGLSEQTAEKTKADEEGGNAPSHSYDTNSFLDPSMAPAPPPSAYSKMARGSKAQLQPVEYEKVKRTLKGS